MPTMNAAAICASPSKSSGSIKGAMLLILPFQLPQDRFLYLAQDHENQSISD